MIPVLRYGPVVAISLVSTYLTSQVVRTESVTVGTITGFYPGTCELTVTAKKRENAKYLQIHVVGDRLAVGLTTVTLPEISVILKNLEKMAEESSKSEDDLSYDRPQSKFSAGIRGRPEPSVSFMVGGVTVAMLGRSEPENRKTLQALIDLLMKGKAILESYAK